MHLGDFPGAAWNVSAWDNNRPGVCHMTCRVDIADAKRILDTIEVAVREQIAREIEVALSSASEASDDLSGQSEHLLGCTSAFRNALSIARGES